MVLVLALFYFRKHKERWYSTVIFPHQTYQTARYHVSSILWTYWKTIINQMLPFPWGQRFRKVFNIFWLPKHYYNYFNDIFFLFLFTFSSYYFHCNSGLKWTPGLAEISGIFVLTLRKLDFSPLLEHTSHATLYLWDTKKKQAKYYCILSFRYNFQNTIGFSMTVLVWHLTSCLESKEVSQCVSPCGEIKSYID